MFSNEKYKLAEYYYGYGYKKKMIFWIKSSLNKIKKNVDIFYNLIFTCFAYLTVITGICKK